jgi:hypothetical protein
MNTIVSLPIAAAVPVASLSMAAPAGNDLVSPVSRLEQAIETLRTRYVCDGWKLDEEGAESALRYYRAGCPDDDEQWGKALYFLASHNLSIDWIDRGEVAALICQVASQSRAALRGAATADPIFAAIEAHKAAAAGTEAVQRRMGALEDELQAKGRLQTERRLEDERRRGEEIEAALDQAHHDEQAAAYALLNVDPTTLAGVIALLTYATEYDDATYGMGWPNDIEAEDLSNTRTWQYFVIANLTDILPKLMQGGA